MKPHGYWIFDRCFQDALKFETRKSWCLGSPSAYGAALRNGWVDACCGHMEVLVRPDGYWTIDRCRSDSAKYSTRVEWRQASPGGHSAACKSGWLDACCQHMPYVNRPNGFWTLSKCAEDARRFHSKSEWRIGSSAAHTAAYKNGWLDECCRHMTGSRKTNGHWNLQRCLEVASQYSFRTEWKSLGQSSYTAAHKNGWLDVCCAHMIETVHPSGYWTFERCLESAAGFSARKDWATSDVGRSAYGAARREGWVDRIAKEVGMKRNDRGQSQRKLADTWRGIIAGTDIDLREEVSGLAGHRTKVDMAFYRDEIPFLAVEFHGAYWHSEARGKGKHYHRDRMNALRAKDIRLITVHEKDKSNPVVMGMIRSALGLTERRVRASLCDLVMAGDITAREFYQASHIQGGDVFGKDQLNIGLEFEGRLIACMTFVRSTGRDTGGGNYDYCLHRFATDPAYRVHGAAGRLFKRFRSIHPDASVVTYCDLQFFTGGMYERIGFNLVRETPPDYGWVKAQNVLDRQQTRRKILPDLLGYGYDTTTSETENMERAGYSKIWDCGKAVYAIAP